MSTDSQRAEALLALARGRFGTLSSADEQLFRAVATGKSADYGIGDEKKDKPANSDKWGDDRTLAADRIAWLCTDRHARHLVTHQGIRLRGARIEGELALDNINVGFWLRFMECELLHGMNLRHSCIGGLNLGGSMTGPIDADGVKVTGSVFLRNGFRAVGEVRFLGAEIRGNLECTNGQFSNPQGVALFADGIKVVGDMFLRIGFMAEGKVRLPGAKIGGALQCHEIDSAAAMCLDLRAARVGTFFDDPVSWPDDGRLCLDGFIYERLDERAPRDAKFRVEWLRRQPKDKFLPQPYEQLAKVLRDSGHEGESKKILIAKNNDPARRKQMMWYQEIWYWIHRCTVAFGYRPERALLWMLGFFIAGALIFSLGDGHGCMRQLTEKSPTFNAFIYSLDTLLPIVDLQQEKYWVPAIGYPAYYLWLHIMAGWLLVSVFVAGLTRSVRS